jgi:hypothetical protein
VQEIAPDSFSLWSELNELWIPASVETMTGASFLPSNCMIEVDNGNQHFGQRADFLMDLKHHWILQYPGNKSEVRM